MFQYHGHGQSREAFREHTGRPTDGRHSIELPETGKARAKMGPRQSTVFGQEPKSDRHISGEVPEAQVSGFEVIRPNRRIGHQREFKSLEFTNLTLYNFATVYTVRLTRYFFDNQR